MINAFLPQVKQVSVVALPILFARATTAAGSFCGMLVFARLGVTELAAGALISNMFVMLMISIWSLQFALAPIIAHHFGAKQYEEIGKLVKQSVLLGVISSIPIMLLMFNISIILELFAIKEDISLIVSKYMHFAVYGVIPSVLTIISFQLLNGIFKPKITVFISAVGSVVNAGLSWLLISNGFGVKGLSLASVVASWVSFLVVLIYLYWNKEFEIFKLNKSIKIKDFILLKLLIKSGMPISFQFVAELAAVTFITILLSHFGKNVLAAQQIVSQVILVVVMVPFSLSQACAVLVSNAYGNRDLPMAKQRHYSCTIFGMLIMTFILIVFLLFSKQIVMFYITNDGSFSQCRICSIATNLVILGLVSQIFDTGRNIAIGSLRGLQDIRCAMNFNVISFWLILVPLGYILSSYTQFGFYGFSYVSVGVMIFSFCFFLYRFECIYKIKEKLLIYN